MTTRPGAAWEGPAVAVLLVVLLGLHLATRDDAVPLGVDATQYVLHAENIAEGRPYAATGYIQNAGRQMAPVAYPPGYPLLLAPVVGAFGSERVPLAIVQILCLLAGAGFFWLLYHRDLRPASGIALVVLIGLNPFLWRMVNRAYSDLPFFAAAGLGLALVHRFAAEGASGQDGQGRSAMGRLYGWAALAGLACGVAILVRILGVALLPAVAWAAVGAGWRRRLGPVALALALAVALPVTVLEAVDWMDGAQIVEGDRAGGGYEQFLDVDEGPLASLAEIPRQALARAVDYARMDREVLWNPLSTARGVHLPLRLAAVVLLLVGVAVRLRRPQPVDVYGAAYLAALLPWSFGQPRYLIPLVPVVYALVLTGGETVWTRARRAKRLVRLGAAAVLAGVAVLLVGFVGQGVVGAAGRLGRGPVAPPDDGSALVLAHAPSGAVLMTARDPRPYVFATRRPAMKAPYEMAEWEAFRRRVGATHVVVRGPDRDEAAMWADRFGWRRIAHNEAADLYAPAP